MMTYANTLDAVDHLSLEEQDQLAATLSQFIAERRSAELIEAVGEARTEFARARIKPASAAAVAKLIKP